VLPYGARVLGLFPADRPNLLWVHPMLHHLSTASQFLKTPGWINLGGDRTWISPERDINVRDLRDPWNSYQFPEAIDPGNFTVQTRGRDVRLATKAELRHHRSGGTFRIQLEKTIRMAPNPLRHDPEAQTVLERVAYSGFEQSTTLSYVSRKSSFRPAISLWDAVELPAGGQVLIPTVGSTLPRDFFEPTGPRHLIASPSGLRFVFDAHERHKIAVRATSLCGGRAGYFRRLARDEATLVVRNFALDPSGEYVDSPWDDPHDRGYALECYNDSGLNGDYGELEYHSPAIGEGTERGVCFDRAQLWGFQGSEVLIAEIMRRLLSSPLTEEFLRGETT